MANNQENSTKKTITYEGWSDKVASDVLNNSKMEKVKASIKNNIAMNINYYQHNIDNAMKLSPTVRILKDMEDYTTVILRCGTFPIWKNTVKKGVFKPVEILEDLKAKVDADFFKKEILSYLDKKKASSSNTTDGSSKGKKSGKGKAGSKASASKGKTETTSAE